MPWLVGMGAPLSQGAKRPADPVRDEGTVTSVRILGVGAGLPARPRGGHLGSVSGRLAAERLVGPS